VTAPLPQTFYDRPVLDVAADLIGCTLLFRGVGGRIVETEAYAHDDPCCHGFRGQTARNAVMFGAPGHLYVYFTYGMHFCVNIVCEAPGRAAAVLLRALEPQAGVDLMSERRGRADPKLLCSGPARLTQALAIGRDENGIPVWREPAVVLPREAAPESAASGPPAPRVVTPPRIVTTTRIGVGDDQMPWRFVDADSDFLSRRLRP
jgi:DNA-3-methyladenine glycosylase